MQKHQPLNPYALESKARLLSFDSELKCWRIGTLTLEDLHLHANPQLVCNKNNLFDMYHDNKACEMCEAPVVAFTVKPEALPVMVDVEDTTSVNLQKCRNKEGQGLVVLCNRKQ